LDVALVFSKITSGGMSIESPKPSRGRHRNFLLTLGMARVEVHGRVVSSKARRSARS
jgi:hypothetical protein